MISNWRTLIFVVVALLALPLVSSVSITINSPLDPIDYHAGGTYLTLNASLGGGNVQTLIYEFNGYNTTLSFTNYSMAIGAMGDVASNSIRQVGEKIITNAPIWVGGYNKTATSGAKRGLVQTLTGINLSICKFVGNYCQFSEPVPLDANTEYYFFVDGNGSSVTQRRKEGGVTHPVVTTWLNYTLSLNNFIESGVNFEGINAANVSNLAPDISEFETLLNASDINNRTAVIYAIDGGTPFVNISSWDYNIWLNEILSNKSLTDLTSELFRINVTWDNNDYDSITGNLYYNGSLKTTSKSGLGNNALFSSSFVLPAIDKTSSQSYLWSFTLTNTTGSRNVNSTSFSTNVNATNFTICGAAPQNNVFLNFTFKDESTLNPISVRVDSSTWYYWVDSQSVSKTYLYSNTGSEQESYAFCFFPEDKPVSLDLEFKYANDTYPQRTYQLNGSTFTNVATNTVLYLLSSDDGIYTTIQIIDQGGSPIPGVKVTAERQIEGIWTVIGEGSSDDAGTVTFWVNPNYNHRFTAVKGGYAPKTVVIQPTQSTYTLTLGTATGGNGTYIPDIEGLTWEVYPGSGPLKPGSTNFNATIYSSGYSLESCKFELVNVNNNSQVYASGIDSTNSTYCYINFDYTTVADRNFFGVLYVDTTLTDGYVILDADFKYLPTEDTVKTWGTITSFFSELKDLSEFGEGNRALFSRLIFFFLISTIVIGVFVYFTSVELQNPGVVILFMVFLTVFASAGGFLTIDLNENNTSGLMEQYAFLLITIMYSASFYLAVLRRANE